MERVVRDMAKQTVKDVTNRFVNDYLSKRFKQKGIDEQDPLRLVSNGILENVMKGIARDIGKECLGGVVYDYMIEAQFISLFNNFYIRREVRKTCQEALEELAIGDVIQNYLDRIVREAVPVIAESEIDAEKKR